MPEKNIHAGHRSRAKAEFLERGLEGLPDHKVLELLLFYSIPQGDVNPLAHRLLDHFGSLSGVFTATHEQLKAVPGVGDHTAALLRLVTAVGARYLQDQVDMKDIFTSGWQFKELFSPYFFGARNEMAYLACLDAKNKLIVCKKLSEGDSLSTEVTARKVLSTALACNAVSVALAHNHISGIALPSAEDMLSTRRLLSVLRDVGVRLYDHYIIAGDDMVSMRDSGYFDSLEDR